MNKNNNQLLLFIALAFIVDYLPFVNLPFLWSQTFFHEISHGLAALLTGGSIRGISLYYNGSGLCRSSGGVPFIISFAGYAGSVLWGYSIYRLASSFNAAQSRLLVSVIVAMLLVTLVLWARDVSTIVILIVLLLMYALPLSQKISFSIKRFIQLVGIFVLLEAVRSPLYLLDGRDLGDGSNLASMTWLPEFFWVALWFAIAVSGLYALWQTQSYSK